jgi:hypothetical protein
VVRRQLAAALGATRAAKATGGDTCPLRFSKSRPRCPDLSTSGERLWPVTSQVFRGRAFYVDGGKLAGSRRSSATPNLSGASLGRRLVRDVHVGETSRRSLLLNRNRFGLLTAVAPSSCVCVDGREPGFLRPNFHYGTGRILVGSFLRFCARGDLESRPCPSGLRRGLTGQHGPSQGVGPGARAFPVVQGTVNHLA